MQGLLVPDGETKGEKRKVIYLEMLLAVHRSEVEAGGHYAFLAILQLEEGNLVQPTRGEGRREVQGRHEE